MKILSKNLCLIWTAIVSTIAVGQQSLDAHTHGHAHMTIVFEKKHLAVEMTTPSANMLDFEHQPSSDRQWHFLELLEQKLQQPENLVELEPACKLKNTAVDLPFKTQAQGLDKLRENEAYQHHSDQNDDTNHAHHSDIHTRYEWLCDKPEFPKLTFLYFLEYPKFETIRVDWVINRKQGMSRLNIRENILEITR